MPFTFPTTHWSGAASDPLLKTDLLALWEFDDASGAIVDAHGSYDMEAVSGLTQNVTGKIDKCVRANGTSSYARYATITNDLTPANNHSISIWIKRTGDGVDGSNILACRFYHTTGNRIFIMSLIQADEADAKSNRLLAQYYDTSNATALCIYNENGPDLWTGNWMHILYTRDNSDLKLYVNAVEVATVTGGNGTSQTTSHSGSYFTIGAAARVITTPDLFMEGDIDQVGNWERTLTQADATYLYNGGAGRAYANWAE